MRTATRFACGVALSVTLAGCSRQADVSLDNRSGRDVVIELPSVPGQRNNTIAPIGKMVEGIPLVALRTLRSGDCAYAYPAGAEVGVARPRVGKATLFSAPSVTYLVRLEPDFALHLFNAEEGGRYGSEVISDKWPAKPTVECRSKG